MRDIPFRFFQLFFDTEVFTMLANNTNEYVQTRRAGPDGIIAKEWRKTCAAELMIFIGIIIYMGVFRSSQVEDYWTRDSEFPQHYISRFISGKRFKMLKRFFHVSRPFKEKLLRHQWTQKLQPLSDILEYRFQQYLLPVTPDSINEMMVRFTGKSIHTTVVRENLFLRAIRY